MSLTNNRKSQPYLKRVVGPDTSDNLALAAAREVYIDGRWTNSSQSKALRYAAGPVEGASPSPLKNELVLRIAALGSKKRFNTSTAREIGKAYAAYQAELSTK
jgi:hypothetical protein